MVSLRLYVEGGGDRKVSMSACRRGFMEFIKRAGIERGLLSVTACGSRKSAYDYFRAAQARADGKAMLLVDAEGPVGAQGAWQHLKSRDGWTRPPGSSDDQCHLMVEIMESWFLADADALASFFGRGFHRQSLPRNPKIEQIPKRDVLVGLDRATRNVRKGRNSKGKHSFEILAGLDPARVTAASPYAKRLVDALLRNSQPAP